MNDKLKPVRCGCGGEAKIITKLVSFAPIERKRVFCSKCYISTEWMKSEAEAITAWNKAMGAYMNSVVSVFSSEVKERTAKVENVDKPIEGSDRHIHVTSCGNCERVVGIFDDYCPGCGARLEWE